MEDAIEKNLLHKADAFWYLYKEHQKEIRLMIEKMDKEMEGTLNYRGKMLDYKLRYDHQQYDKNVLYLG